jgi:hypothetical protein
LGWRLCKKMHKKKSLLQKLNLKFWNFVFLKTWFHRSYVRYVAFDFNDNKAKFNDFFEMLDEEDKTLCDRCKLLNNMSNEGNCIHHLFGAKVNDWSWLEKKD